MASKQLTAPRKLYSIKTGVFDENYIHPGFSLPGPEIPRLTEEKIVDGITHPVGAPDPEWVAPDEVSIHIGTAEGRDYYSIRADISTDVATLGEYEVYDPQDHETVDDATFEILRISPQLQYIFRQEGVKTDEERFREAFPTFASIKEAIIKDPQGVADFLAQDLIVDTDVLAKLGVHKAAVA